MKTSTIRKIAVSALCAGMVGVAGIASARDWPLSGLFRPLVHAPVRVVVEVPVCPRPVYVHSYARPVFVPEVVITRDRYHRDRYERRRDWR